MLDKSNLLFNNMVVMKMWLLLGLFCWAALCSTGCIKYLAKLQQMSKLAP